MIKPYVKPSEMVKPPNMPWGEYMNKAFALDREWGHELHSNAAFMQLLDFTCARLAKARLTKSQIEASGPRLMLPKVLVVAGSRVVAKAPSAPAFARTRSSAEVQRAIARRIALR
jgi:hypothetical protein